MIRLLIAYTLHRNMNKKQLDIKTDFLNGRLDAEIYIKVPDGLITEPGRARNQSPRQWNKN